MFFKINAIGVFYCLVLLLISTIYILLYFSNKGFDLTDEGLYAIVTNPEQSITMSAINYDLLFKFIARYLDYSFDIQGLRLLRICMNLIGAGTLFLGVLQFISKTDEDTTGRVSYLIFVILLSFYSSYNFPIQTPGYNELAFFAVQIFAGSFLIIILKGQLSFLEFLVCSVSSAIGFVILYVTKPTGVPFIFAFSALLLLFKLNRISSLRFAVVWTIILILIIYFPLDERVTLDNYFKIFSIINKSSTTHSIFNILFNLIIGFSFLSIAFFCGFYYKNYLNKPRVILVLIVLSIIVIIADFHRVVLLYSNLKNFYSAYFFTRINYACALAFSASCGFLLNRHHEFNWKSFSLFLLIPLNLFMAIYFGTNDSFLSSFPKAFQFYFIAFFLVFPVSKRNSLYLIISIVLLVKFIIVFFILHPFNQEALYKQNRPLVYGKNSTSKIYLDSITLHNQILFTKAVSARSTKFVVGYQRMEGFIYLSGKVYPGSFLWGEEDLDAYFKYRFNHPDTFILVVDRSEFHKLSTYLNRYQIELYYSVKMLAYRKTKIEFSFYLCKRK